MGWQTSESGFVAMSMAVAEGAVAALLMVAVIEAQTRRYEYARVRVVRVKVAGAR